MKFAFFFLFQTLQINTSQHESSHSFSLTASIAFISGELLYHTCPDSGNIQGSSEAVDK